MLDYIKDYRISKPSTLQVQDSTSTDGHLLFLLASPKRMNNMGAKAAIHSPNKV